MAEEKKYAESRARANLKYQRKFAHVSINVPRDVREKAAEYCDQHGTSLNKLINEYLEALVNG